MSKLEPALGCASRRDNSIDHDDAIARYLLLNAVMGAILGLLFGLMLIATDVTALRALLAAAGNPLIGIVCILTGSVSTFTPLAVCTAVGLLRYE